MENELTILQELREVAPSLEAINRSMPYEIPEGYFDLLPAIMLAKLATPSEKPAIPEGYFETFPEAMLAKIRGIAVTEELEETAPLLSTISKKPPYHVPGEYFENLKALQQSAKQTPVVSLKRKNKVGMWAAAACAVALAGLLSWQFLWRSPAVTVGNNLAKNSTIDTTINNEFAGALSQLEDNSLTNELNENDIHEESRSALYYLNTENFETALHDFSDQELSDHLADVQAVVKEKS